MTEQRERRNVDEMPAPLLQPGTLVTHPGALAKVGEGGGTDSEDITVHRVPVSGIAEAIADWRAQGPLR